MNRQTIFRAVAALAVMLAVNTGAQAQLGGALNRARNAVQNTGNRISTPGKPSAEAVAADPRASVEQAEEGYTRTPAQIRGAYEALDKKLFFGPYYHPNLRRYYILDDSQREQEFLLNSAKTLDEHWRKDARTRNGWWNVNGVDKIRLNTYNGPTAYGKYTIVDTIPAGNTTPWGCFDDCIGVMPVGVHVIYAGFALFKADPQGLKPFMRFCEAQNAFMAFRGSLSVGGGIDGKTLRDNPDKLAVKWADIAKLNSFETDLEEAAKSVPMNVIHQAATYYRDQVATYDAVNDGGNSRFYFHLFETAMFYWQENNRKQQMEREMNALLADYLKYAGKYDAWVTAEKTGGAPVDMPPTYNMGAPLAAKALEIAKKQFENRNADPFKVDRIVFLTDKWSEAKLWFTEGDLRVERVVMRTVEVGVLTDQDGKWIMRQWTLQQDSDMRGGWKEEYRYVAGTTGTNYQPKPVNYKP